MSPALPQDLIEAEAAFYAAMRRGDADAMAPFMAEDCVYIHSRGNRDSKQSYLDRVRSGYFVYGSVDVTQEEVVIRGDVVMIIGTMTGVVTAGGAERVLDNIRSSVWVRNGTGWQLALFQATPWLAR